MSIAEKLQIVAENEQKVYEAGKKTQYDEFWDAFQDYGNKTNYANAFGGYWNEKTLRPKYDIVPTNMYMFTHMDARGGTKEIEIEDLAQHFENLGIKLDTSKCNNFQYAFTSHLATKRLGVIDTRSASNGLATQFIFNCPVNTIDELILAETHVYNNYSFLAPLKNVKFSGRIGKSIYFQNTVLTPESMISAIGILKNYNDTEYEGVYEIKFSTSCWNALEAYGNAPENYTTWAEYVQYGLGWNI